MNKQDLAAAMAEGGELSVSQAHKAIDALVAVVKTALKKGEDVRLVGFGVFSVKARAGRKGRNPATGIVLDIPACNVPEFKAGKDLKEAVNTV